MEKKTTRNLGIAILMVCLFAIGFVSGRLFQANNASISNVFSGRSDINFQLYWNVWDLMQSKYVDSSKIDDQNMLYGFKGMVNSFGDAATVFLDPEETKTFNEASEGKLFQGIGAELGYDGNNQIIVVSPLEGSPAKAAGIKAGDYILTIDGVAIASTDTVYDAVAKIRGEAGTKVTLGILHKGATKAVDIEITRSEITVPSMELSYIGDNKDIALFQVSRFTDSSYSEWTKNWDGGGGGGGGYFDAAIYAADDFVGAGKVLAQEQDSAGKIQKFNSTRGGKLESMEVVVLVDGGSASASEILSGALQQSGRATIIGDKTYGKGTAQSVLDLSDGSTLHVTILKWLLPDGGWLNHDNPITPNIEIANSEKDFTKGIDTQLNKAISEIEN